MRKPIGLNMRTYVNHLTRINDRELPLLPPFNLNQGLSEYELKDIIHNGLPNSWKNEMIRQGFDPLLRTMDELVLFCERQEATTSAPSEVARAPNNHSQKQHANHGPKHDAKNGQVVQVPPEQVAQHGRLQVHGWQWVSCTQANWFQVQSEQQNQLAAQGTQQQCQARRPAHHAQEKPGNAQESQGRAHGHH